MLLKLSKLFLTQSQSLFKIARKTIPIAQFLAGSNKFLDFFKEFIGMADEDQKSDLNNIKNLVENYIQALLVTNGAFDNQNWSEANNGFLELQKISEDLDTQMQNMKSQDPDVFILVSDGEDFDVSESVDELVDLGRSIMTDLFSRNFEAIDRDRQKNPNLYNDREVDNSPEPEKDDDASEIENMLGYRQKADPMQNINDTTHDAEILRMDQLQKERAHKAKEKAKLKANYQENMRKWRANYYRENFKNTEKYAQALAKSKVYRKNQWRNWKRYEALNMSNDMLVKYKEKDPTKYNELLKLKNEINEMSLKNPETLEKIKKDWEYFKSHNEKQKVYNKKYDEKRKEQRKDKRREDRLEKLLKMVNRY